MTQIQRTAFVTGAAQGLGAAIAKALIEAGHAVALVDINYDKVELIAAGYKSDKVIALAADVRDQRSMSVAATECARRLGPVDILVNNAARTQPRNFFEMDLAEWDDVIATNLKSIVIAAQLMAGGMMERGWGRIINVTSIAGQRGGPQVQGAHYAASKAGIIGLNRYLAHLFAEGGVTVNAIAPGTILTEQTALAPPEKLALVLSQIPLKRIGQAEEVASLAAYLASDAAGFITGTTMDVNGGVLMR